MFYTKPLTLEKPLIRDTALVLLASFVICLSGQISIPLWFTPVPLVTQNAMVLLMALLLGARRGGTATFLFLIQGAIGLPVFANGHGGLHTLLGVKAGYLFGYFIASFITGYLAERKKPIAALAAGNLTIYLCGAGYLATFVGLSKAFLLGIAPFVFGDLLKALASLKFLHWATRK